MNERRRILVCDDEPQIVRALRVILRDAGFEAVPASSGEEALDLVAVRPPQAAVLDLMLPDLDGVEVTRRIREWSEMPIVVLSAIGDEDKKVEALAAGADDYVTKPFGPRELVARLEAALRRARPEAEEPAITVEGLEIDLAARRVRRDGEDVHLTPTEFELLRVLVRNRGRLMTHRALLVEVWGVEYEDDLQVLRAHVATPPPHLPPVAGPGSVRPDRGVGYRLAASRGRFCVPGGRKSAFTRSVYAGRSSSRGLDGDGRMIGACLSSVAPKPRRPWRSAPPASSSAISAPARCTRCRRSSTPPTRTRWRRRGPASMASSR